jgi:hypothetical protein
MSTDALTDPLPAAAESLAPSGDAVQAFDELRLEVLKTQQTLVEMRAAAPPDYTPSLGALAQAIQKVSAGLVQLQGHPALQLSPSDYQRAFTQCSQNAMREVIAQLTETHQASDRTQQALMSAVGAVRSQRQQARWLAIASALALNAGLLLAPLLARLLPFGLDTRIAAIVMANDRWNAGQKLMQADDAQQWDTVWRASQFWHLNQAAIAACEQARIKTHREQPCGVSLLPP